MEGYTKVNQDWIDNYIDGFKYIDDITFYDENKNPAKLHDKNIKKYIYKWK